jgi:hypothetical protein
MCSSAQTHRAALELGADESSDGFGRVINEMARQRKDDEPGN